VQEVLDVNGVRPKLFAEPFAGGASISLHILAHDCAERVLISDLDPLVASFWRVLFDKTDWLIEQVLKVEVTLDMWRHFKRQTPSTDEDRALACLFLNRTSFSGIIARSGGPIGGVEQQSVYKLDCRFPRDRLAERIRKAARYREKVEVRHATWEDVLGQHGSNPDAFFYLDPPFFSKADRLYNHCFANGDHEQLRNALVKTRAKWLLSYDPSPRIDELYSTEGLAVSYLQSLHSTAGPGGIHAADEVVVTNLRKLPRETRLWRSSLEWTTGKNNQ
jgi:DNA adenine methylase